MPRFHPGMLVSPRTRRKGVVLSASRGLDRLPGEGLLVGSFARITFLVHSECAVSKYVGSRPFRVNAGPVHSYIVGGGGETRYLSELCTGKQVRF